MSLRHEIPVHMITTMAAANYGLDHTQHAYGLILYALVHWLKPRTVVEIGSRRGFSAMWMAKALYELGQGGKLHCIEPFIQAYGGGPEQSQEFIKNIEHLGLANQIQLHVKTSQEAAEEIPQQIGMLFCDGDLSQKGLISDLKTYEYRIPKGGCLAIHDLKSEPGVAPAIKECWEIMNHYITMALDDQLGLFYGVKVG